MYYILFTLFDPIQSALVVPSLFGSLQSIIVYNVKIQDQAIHNEPRLTNVHDVKNNNELHNLYKTDLEIVLVGGFTAIHTNQRKFKL